MEIEDRSSSQRRRFVILRHELPALHAVDSHWDLMFEREGALLCLRCAKLPDFATPNSRSVAVTCLDDHRLEYLDYEGPVSGNRGHVARLVGGHYCCLPASKPHVERFVLVASNLDAIFEVPLCKPGENIELECLRWDLREAPRIG